MYLDLQSFLTDIEVATERRAYMLQLKSFFKVTSSFPQDKKNVSSAANLFQNYLKHL